MFKKILVGIDISAETEHAFEDALAIAKVSGAVLNLMHVFSWDDAYDQCLAILYSELQEIENNEELFEHHPLVKCMISKYRGHEQSDALIKYKTIAEEAGIQAEIEPPRQGRPGRSLCNAAGIGQADLIVVGHRDKDLGKRQELGELRLGSVSHEVIHHAPCSVLIAHRTDVGAGSLAGMSHILAALDNSEMSQYVFQESLDLAKATGASLTLLNILTPSDKDRSVEMLQTLKDRANAEGVSVSIEQLTAEDYSIGKTICEFSSTQGYDLIVVGRRRLLEVQELILGSVSHYTSYHAPCSVIIVQPSR